VAAQAAIVDHLSRGRLSLAFGYGYRTEEYEGFGLEMKARGTRVSRAIEAVREGFQAFEPFQKPCPPLWLAGGSQAATARRAGRLGVHYWAPGVGLQHTQVGALVSEYRRAGAESGFAPHELRVGIATDVAIAETREEAQRIVSEDVLPVYAEQLVAFGFIRDADGKPIRALPPDHPIFQVLLGSFVVGTPDDVIAGIERYRALGCDVFMPRLVEANFRGSRILGEMRLFAETVIPHFAGMRPS